LDDLEKDKVPVEAEAKPELIYEYVCHPARRNRVITILTTVFILICLVLVWMISYEPLLVALGALILFGALGGFYFPTRYFFYDDFFVIKTKIQTVRKPWSQYRSFFPDKNGVLLSPFARPTRLENFRGLYIKFEKNRDKVLEIIKTRINFESD